MLKKETEIKSPRNAYGETLVELGKSNKNIVVLDADLSCSTQTCKFHKAYPERFFNCGIAEQDMMCTAAGLACEGKIPFVSTFAMFATARCLDQIRNSICYPKLNVKIVATHGGITVGEDGASHQALEDISYMRSIPDMSVIVPADYNEVKQVIKYVSEIYGPVYVRLARTNLRTIFDENEYVFNPERAVKIFEGSDVTIVTNGETLWEVMSAAKMLKEKGISAEVLHTPVVKPFFAAADVIESASKTGLVITVENHSVTGGLGSAVCEVLSANYPVRVLRIGTPDCFGQSGEQRALMEFFSLTDKRLCDTISRYLNKL